jgi:hypothetical protein
MKHFKITAYDIPDAYVQALDLIRTQGDDFTVGYGSEETLTKKISTAIEITNPANRPLIHLKAPNDDKYLREVYFPRLLWGLSGEPHWGLLPDEHYTYAQRMREPIDQVTWAMQRLVDEPRDRQLVITIARSDDIVKKPYKFEPPCLRQIGIEVLNNQLHIFPDFRSWDCPAGLPINLAGLQLWNEQFVHEVNLRGNRNLEKCWTNLTTGKIIATSKNLHIYKREFPWVDKFFETTEDSRRITKDKFVVDKKYQIG